jgi:aminoglycoside phosphotransferase (APT) family kinase protein
VRLPRLERAAGQVAKELRWLPVLAPLLPLAVPVPRGRGRPAWSYPWDWSVHPWLDGDNATIERLADPCEAARTLAQFVVALQRIDAAEGPPCGAHNEFRGVPLARRDALVHEAIGSLADLIDARAVRVAWQTALQTPEWRGPPVWLHGDIHAGNLLARRGRISAVIDFGLLGVGDPACDLMVAWNLLGVDARKVFRAASGVDDATWARARGWTLSVALIALAYYLDTNPALAAMSQRAIDEVLAD